MNHRRSILDKYGIHKHDFDESPFIIIAEQIKRATSHFKSTTEREVTAILRLDGRNNTNTMTIF